MVSTKIRKDGWNSTQRVIDSLKSSKFLPQLHLVMFDGLAFGGFNVVDLTAVSEALELPAVAVVRRPPDFRKIEDAIQNLSRPKRRWELIRRAGPVHEAATCCFQVVGAAPDEVERALDLLTDRGHLPEAIRIAHLVGSAVVLGESGRRA